MQLTGARARLACVQILALMFPNKPSLSLHSRIRKMAIILIHFRVRTGKMLWYLLMRLQMRLKHSSPVKMSMSFSLRTDSRQEE